MKRTLTAIAVALGSAGVVSGPALAASSVQWDHATTAKEATIQGMVTGVNAEVETFTLDTRHMGSVVVNVGQMGDNPLDEEGRIQLERGDNVSAMGMIGRDIADQLVLEASNVSLFVDDSDPAN